MKDEEKARTEEEKASAEPIAVNTGEFLPVCLQEWCKLPVWRLHTLQPVFQFRFAQPDI